VFVCAGATPGALGFVCAGATPVEAIRSASATAARILVIVISHNSGSADCGMQNSRSAHYSALPGQSRSAYHASKSAWLFDWVDFQAQHSELRSKVFVGPLVNLTRAAGRQVSDSFLRTADIAECVTAKRSFDLSHAGVPVVVRNPVGRRGTARLGREDSNLRMAE
jgi:hypothetical protein